MTPPDKRERINLLNPSGSSMRREVKVIMLVLAGWLGAIIGFQLLVLLLENTYASGLNDITLFNLPIHFWLSGQLLPLWFVILCGAFNLWVDRHTAPEQHDSLRMKLHVSGQQTGEK